MKRITFLATGFLFSASAFALPISIESSDYFAEGSFVGCQKIKWGADGPEPTYVECGSAAVAGESFVELLGPNGSLTTGIQLTNNSTDDVLSLYVTSLWHAIFFEGTYSVSVGWSSVFTSTQDALLNSLTEKNNLTERFGSYELKNLSTGESSSGDYAVDVRLNAGDQYSLIWTAGFGFTDWESGVSGSPQQDRGYLTIVGVPEPSTNALMIVGLIWLSACARRARPNLRS